MRSISYPHKLCVCFQPLQVAAVPVRMSGRAAAASHGSGKACGSCIDKCMHVWCGWFALAEYGRGGDAGGSLSVQ